MSEQDLEKLLGGFAADTLTTEERQKLFTAALQDQQLFNALADEQALKELLADPAVRRRLLQALNQLSTSGVGGHLSWLDWFRRPAGLAFAGGLAAAVFSIVLGTKIYQDSRKQAAQSVALEESKPAIPPAPVAPLPAPSVTEMQEKAKAKAEPLTDIAKKDAVTDKLTRREQPTQLTAPPEQPAADLTGEGIRKRADQDESHKPAAAPGALSGKVAEEVTSSADKEQLAKRTAPSAAISEPAPMSAPAGTPLSGTVAPTVSARALFYAGVPSHSDQRAMAAEKEQGLKSLPESTPQASRPEQKLERSPGMMKTREAAAQLKPLGLRYGFILRGSDGQDREVDVATALRSTELVRLTVEANQDAYLQIWKTVGSSTPQLLFPEKDSGQISMKMLAGQRQNVPLPTDSGTVTLTARLSRKPFGPITRQEAAMLDRFSSNQLQESITASEATGTQEQATYIVNQDPSPAAQLSVHIPLRR
jgi:hypothetical protein